MKYTLEKLDTDAGPYWFIQGPNGFQTIQPSKENAEFVVRACNAYPELLAGLKSLLASYQADFKNITGAELSQTETVKKIEKLLNQLEP